mgnify:CR=1 FL=1
MQENHDGAGRSTGISAEDEAVAEVRQDEVVVTRRRESCAECRAWVPDGGVLSTYGECHRRAPLPGLYGHWPRTRAADMCLDWLPAEAPR